jgi:hypothetical protein
MVCEQLVAREPQIAIEGLKACMPLLVCVNAQLKVAVILYEATC